MDKINADAEKSNGILTKDAAKNLKDIFESGIISFESKDSGENNTQWLSRFLSEQIPDKVNAEKTAEEIMSSLSAFVHNLSEIRSVEQKGKSKETWLSQKLMEADGLSEEEKNKALCLFDTVLYNKNMEMAEAHDAVRTVDQIIEEVNEREAAGFTQKQMEDVCLDIGKNASAVTLQSVAMKEGTELARQVFSEEQIHSREWVNEALNTENNTDLAVITSGVLKIAAEKGIIPELLSDTPIEIVSGIAGMGVENVRISNMMAQGSVSINRGLQMMEQVGISMIYQVWKVAKYSMVSFVTGVFPPLAPVVAVLSDYVGNIVARIASKKLSETIMVMKEKIASAAKTVAKVMVSGLKKAREKIILGLRRVKEKIKKIFI